MQINKVNSYNPSFSARVDWAMGKTVNPALKSEIETFAQKIGSPNDSILIHLPDKLTNDLGRLKAFTARNVEFFSAILDAEDSILSCLKHLSTLPVTEMSKRADEHHMWLRKFNGK